MVSNNINPKFQYQNMQTASPSFSAMPAQMAPNMSGGLEDTSLGKSLDKSQADLYLTLGLTVPTYFGLSKLYQLITKANGGEYSKSLIGRIAGFGDKIANSGFAQSGFMHGVEKNCKSVKNFVVDKIIKKSKALSAMVYTPSVPETSFAKMGGGAVEEVAGDFVSFVNKFTKNGGKLADLGLTEQTFETISKNPKANLDTIKQICRNVGNTQSIKQGKLIKRTVTLEQIGNRLKAMTEGSKLGKILAKSANRGAFGLFVGGGIFMLLSAHAIAEAITRTKNAEKGDKFSTFMEGFLGNMSWVVTFPIGLKLMNAVAGLKYLGKTPDQVQAYRAALKAFNAQAANGFTSKAAYKQAKQALNAAKKAGKPGFLGKLLSIPGKFLSYGREVVKPYIKANPVGFSEKLGNFARKIPYVFRNKFLAFAIGIGTYMAVFSPIVDKLFRKVSYALFGKPKHSMYDEEPTETVANTQQIQEQPSVVQSDAPIEHNSPTNLMNMLNNGQKYNGVSGQNAEIKNEQEKSDNKTEPVRTYIPSSQGVQLQAVDTSAADAALKRSEIAEKRALETLAMKF